MKKLSIQTDDAGRIVALVIFDKSGSTTDIRFSGIEEDAGIADKQFVFTAPKGTEIIEQ
jgi:outer membrane lipoprotein-sorting protein